MAAEAECGVPMTRMPWAEMAAEVTAIPMRRPVMSNVAVMHTMMEVVVVKMMAVEIVVMKVAETTAKGARQPIRCRECDNEQTKSSPD